MFDFRVRSNEHGTDFFFQAPSLPAAIDTVFGPGARDRLVRSGNHNRIVLRDGNAVVGSVQTLGYAEETP